MPRVAVSMTMRCSPLRRPGSAHKLSRGGDSGLPPCGHVPDVHPGLQLATAPIAFGLARGMTRGDVRPTTPAGTTVSGGAA